MVTFKIDDRKLRSALKQYLEVSGKDAVEVLEKRADMLVSGGKGVKGLFQEARTHAPETKAEIRSLPTRLNWHIKRKKGMTAAKEIKRRLRYAGWLQSTGWLNKRYGREGAGNLLRHINSPRGMVHAKLSGNRIFIRITNTTKGSGDFAAKTGYVQRAVDNAARDLMVYVKRKMQQRAHEFSR